jgi:hypothetical protein
MISVSIGGMSVALDKAGEGWITQMLTEARKGGSTPCVRVTIDVSGAKVGLATPGRGGGGGSRLPNDLERRILDAWNRRGLGSVPET